MKINHSFQVNSLLKIIPPPHSWGTISQGVENKSILLLFKRLLTALHVIYHFLSRVVVPATLDSSQFSLKNYPPPTLGELFCEGKK
jgi:hypothetical protein